METLMCFNHESFMRELMQESQAHLRHSNSRDLARTAKGNSDVV
jgi:hypothetical protein